MKILVIGSNSFSGSNFVLESLELGYEVIGVSRSEESKRVFLPYKWNKNSEKFESKFCFYKINLNKDLPEFLGIIDDFKPEIVVNFAAQGMVAESWLNPTHWYQTNVVSQVALHDELRKKSFIKKYVHITTPEVYGSTDDGWINEETTFSPSTPYAVSRAACDLHLKSFFDSYDFPVIFTRAANVYGPGQQLYRLIPRTFLSCFTGLKMNLHGGGLSKRSFIHIKDVVKATLKLAENGEPGTTWHISTNEIFSIKQIVEKICKITNTNFNEIVEISSERLGKDQNYLLDSQSLRKNFNWKEEISLDDGLKDTMQWIQSNLDNLVKLSWSYEHKT